MVPAVCPVEKAGTGDIRADCLEEEANGQHQAGWEPCPWRRRGGRWTAGSGEGGLDTHLRLLCGHSGRNPSWTRCKAGVTHPAGTAHRKGGALHRSSERQPRLISSSDQCTPHPRCCPGPPPGHPSPGTNALAWRRTRAFLFQPSPAGTQTYLVRVPKRTGKSQVGGDAPRPVTSES